MAYEVLGTLKSIRSYLQDMKQYVSINGSSSPHRGIKMICLKLSKFILYAEDANIIVFNFILVRWVNNDNRIMGRC